MADIDKLDKQFKKTLKPAVIKVQNQKYVLLCIHLYYEIVATHKKSSGCLQMLNEI